MTTHALEPLLDADDVASALKVSKRTAYVYMASMTRVVPSDGCVRVTRAALDAFIRAHTVEPLPPRVSATPSARHASRDGPAVDGWTGRNDSSHAAASAGDNREAE